MSYLSRDTSRQSGAPVVLFLFTQGLLEWRYTSAAQPIEALGYTWEPVSVAMGGVTQSNDMTKDTLSVKLPRDDSLATSFLGYVPDQTTSVTIYRGHLDDPEFLVYWKGRVASYKVTGDNVSLECEPIFTSLRRPGLRARYQKSCRFALYGRGCRLNSEGWATPGRCTGINGAVVTVPEAASLPAGWLIGGMLRSPDGILRYIVNHVGDQVTLMRPVKSLVEAFANSGYGYNYGSYYGGVEVKLYPGCDRSRTTCEGKFNNLDNYGGFPWIPTTNPFGGSSIA